MTASIVSEHAVAPLVLCRAGLHLVKSDGVANVLGRVSTRVIRPVVRRHTNYGVDWERHPLVLWGDEAVRPDLGLRWVLEERARRIGREVRVDRECSPFCELVMPPGYAGTCTELLSWIADHELGLIHYASNVWTCPRIACAGLRVGLMV